LNAKHPTASSPRLDGRQHTLHDFSRKITRPVRENVTNALEVWVAGEYRPVNIVEDDGLTEVIRIASGDNSYDLSLYDGERAPLCLKKNIQLNNSVQNTRCKK